MRRESRRSFLRLIPALAASLSAAAAAQQPPELLVYSAIRPANWDLYLFETPGAPGRPLTDDAGLDYNAAISPDGRYVVFASERAGQADLYALDRQKGGAPRRLTDEPSLEDAPAFSPDGKRLAFVSTRDGNADIFIMPFQPGSGARAAGGPAPVNLTRSEGGDFNPAFSPDGRFIAFTSNRGGLRYGTSPSPPPDYQAGDIYVMRADGSEVRRLTDGPGWEGTPAWSPDGRSIYYYAVRDGTPRLFLMGRDGSSPRPVSPAGVPAHSPAVRKDGRLAYAAFRHAVWSIVSMAPDGSDPRLESDPQRDAWAPAWDPRTGRIVGHGPGPLDTSDLAQAEVTGPFRIPGRSVVALPDRTLEVVAIRGYFPSIQPLTGEVATSPLFQSIEVSRLDGKKRREILAPEGRAAWKPAWAPGGAWLAAVLGPPFGGPEENADIVRLRRDGGGLVNLTAGSTANDAFPDVSPDGRSIVFRSGRDGNNEIYLMDADGSRPRRLTHDEGSDTMPAFSPRGDRIAFASDRDGNFEIYLLDLDGEGRPGRLQRLTRHPGLDTHPVFSPDGRWVAYTSERGGLNDETPLIPVFNAQPYGEIVATRIEDGLTVRLTHNKWEDGLPEWAAASGPAAAGSGPAASGAGGPDQRHE